MKLEIYFCNQSRFNVDRNKLIVGVLGCGKNVLIKYGKIFLLFQLGKARLSIRIRTPDLQQYRQPR